jgi:hypothetical protein
MRRGEECRVTGEPEAVPVAGRRAFLAMGVGCALPLAVGAGIVKAGGLARPLQDGAAPDPIWDYIAAEASRLAEEVRGPLGVRGEHLRRLAAQLDLAVVHLRGRGEDRQVDDEVRRLLRERGRYAAALDVIDARRTGARRPDRRPVRSLEPDVEKMARRLEHLGSKGTVKSLRAHRAPLERLAAQLDRELAERTGRPVTVRQKPGDDFGGFPPPPPPLGFCESLEIMILDMMTMAFLLGTLGFPPGVVAADGLGLLFEALWFFFCRKDA